MASRIKGLTVEIGGNTTKLQKALAGVDDKISRTSTALKDVNKLLKFNPGNTELLKQKQQMLTESIQQTKSRLEELRKVQEGMDAKGVDKNSKEYQTLRREIIDTETSLKRLESQFKQFGTVAGQQLIAAGQKMQEFGRKIQDVGRSISDLGGKLTRSVTVPIAAVGTAAVKTAAEFEAGMSEVQAISGASAQEMEKLEASARKMGTESVFSASEAAQAYKYMGMAGWDASQMVEGLPAVMNLAAASGEDLAMVSDIVTDGLTAFGLSAEEASHFADVLATAATNSNTNVSMMGESFKYAAPLAGSLGYSVEDVSHALGLMANAGIKSTQAGTTLRTLLQNMAKPTDAMQAAMDRLGVSLEDGEGGMLSLHSVLMDLRSGFGQLRIPQEELISSMEQLDAAFEDGSMTEKEYAEAQEELMRYAYGAEGALMAQNAAALAGARGLSGLLAIVNTSDEEFDGLYNALIASDGAAQQMADTMSDNLVGQLKKLKNNAKELGIQFGNIMMPAIKKVVTVIQDLTKKLQNLSPKQKENIVRFAALAAAVGPVLVVVGKLTQAFGTFVVSLGKVTSGFGHLINIMAANPFAAVAVGAVALAAGITKIADAMTTTPHEIFTQKLAAAKEEMASVNAMTENYQQLAAQRDADVQKAEAQIGYSQRQKEELDQLLSKTGELTEGERTRANFLAGELLRATGQVIDEETELIKQYQDQKTAIEDVMVSMRNKAILQANEAMYNEAIIEESNARDKATTAYNAYMSVAESAAATQAQYNALMDEFTAKNDMATGSAMAFGAGTEALEAEIARVKQQMSEENAELANLEQQYISAEVAAAGYSSTIANYETVAAQMAAGAEVDAQALENLKTGFISAKDGGQEYVVALAQQVTEANAKYEELKTAADNGMAGVTEAMVEEARQGVEKALAEYEKMPDEAKTAIDSLGTSLSQGIEAARSNVETSSQSVVRSGVDTMDREGKAAETSGYNTGVGYGNGIASSTDYVVGKATALAQAANRAFQATQQIKSPSRVWKKFGQYTVEGLVLGMESMRPKLERTASGILGVPDSSGVNLDASRFGSTARTVNPATQKMERLTQLVSDLVDMVGRGGDVYIDGDTVAGVITPTLNRNLGIIKRGMA